MWVLLMIIGAMLGGAVANFSGAVVGGVLGAIVGGILTLNARTALDKRLKNIEDAIRRLDARLHDVETNAAAPARPAMVSMATAMSAEAAASAVDHPVPPDMPQPLAEPVPVASIAHDEVAQAQPQLPPVEPPPVPQPPRKPSAIWRFFFGGNTLVRVGIIVLFFGVAFLLKYAAEHNFIPIELRLAGVALGGVALLVVGWRLRGKRTDYALMLQGGGVGVLYLTVFAALKMYHLIPPTPAFVVLAGIAVFSALMAIVQDSRALAITGAAGGFLAPILASAGGGSHVALFSFYAVLNAGILFIAYFKAWRELNLVGFVFTVLIGFAWGDKYYRPELFATTEPFVILFFLMYVAIAILFALRQAPKLTHYVEGTVVFGTPIVAFGMQISMVRGMEFGAAWSALAVAAFYLLLATVLNAKKHESLRLLVESFLALGVGFATLAVPLALDGRWTSAVWAVEGAAVVWAGVRQNRKLARAFGLALQLAAGVAFLDGTNGAAGAIPGLNSLYLGCVMISTAGLFCSGYLERNRAQVAAMELVVARLLFVWGALWWFAGGVLEIERHVKGGAEWNAELIFFAGSCAAFAALWQRLQWNMARYTALAILPLLAGTALGIVTTEYGANAHPFLRHAYVGWLLGFVVHFLVLRLHENNAESKVVGWWHAAGFWLLAFVASWEFGWRIDRYVEGNRVWPLIAWALVPALLIAVFAARAERLGWPVRDHRRAYLYLGAFPVAAFLIGWIVYANFTSNGNPAPLPYLPLLNPLDIVQAGTLLALAMWYLGTRRMEIPGAKLPSPANALKLLGVVSFVVLNGVLLRTLHHYAGVPFRLHAMMHSMLVQASLSLFWSLLALAAMFFATRRGLRGLWFVGAGLLAVVIAKLVLIDLSNTGTVERIVSFIGVGLFCVVIGYFAPVPPKANKLEIAGESI